MSDDKETTNLSDLDEQLLNEAIVSTNGRDYTQEEIEHLALENELTPQPWTVYPNQAQPHPAAQVKSS